MYAVSEEYREAMHSKVQTFRLTGTAGNKPFTEANILKGSFSITNQCSGSDAVEIGQVYIDELNATFMNMGMPDLPSSTSSAAHQLASHQRPHH